MYCSYAHHFDTVLAIDLNPWNICIFYSGVLGNWKGTYINDGILMMSPIVLILQLQ